MPETINNPSYIVQQIKEAGSKIYFSDGKLQIKPSITNTYPDLLKAVKENKSNIITFLIRKWTSGKDIFELSSLPVIFIFRLPLQPILEIQIPGLDQNIFFDFRKQPNMDQIYGIVFDETDIKNLIKYFESKNLSGETMLIWCKRKLAKQNCHIPACVDKFTVVSNVSLERILLPMTSKLVSVRLEN